MFAASQLWNCKTIGYDYNKKGIEFAKRALGITESKVAKDIYRDTFNEKAKFVTLIHTFEHLREPSKFLQHLKDQIIKKSGYLYLEVPNLNGCPLSDPTHFFTYSLESLRFVLEKNGFKVLAMVEHGKPLTKNGVWENPIMNISVLAQLAETEFAATKPNFNAETILKELYNQHRRIIRKSILKTLDLTIRSIIRSLYMFIFIFILERFSYRLAKKLKALLLNRKSNTS